MAKWGSPVEIERRNRICVLLWAYAYEIKAVSLVSDHEFDRVCLLIDPLVDTGHAADAWFLTEFHPCTGSWIHSFPFLDGIKKMYQRVTAPQPVDDGSDLV